jgi:AcrR family transcriptional regulator
VSNSHATMTLPGDETRVRILETAWEQIRRRGTTDVTIAQIAAAAGVSRQLVYFHFANRAGLLTAMAHHRDEATGFVAEAARSRAMAPVEGFEHLLRSWCAYLPDILPVARALEAALITGDEGGSAWRDRMNELHQALRIALHRLARRGQLADGWTVDAAADWAWSRVQPTTWQHLVGERAWTPEDYAERTIGSLLGELVAARRAAPQASRAGGSGR